MPVKQLTLVSQSEIIEENSSGFSTDYLMELMEIQLQGQFKELLANQDTITLTSNVEMKMENLLKFLSPLTSNQKFL